MSAEAVEKERNAAARLDTSATGRLSSRAVERESMVARSPAAGLADGGRLKFQARAAPVMAIRLTRIATNLEDR